MEAMARETWTDERMDDLSGRVERGFNAVDLRFDAVQREFIAVRTEMRTEFAAVRGEMREEFAAVRSEMREEFAAFRSEMREEFAAMRAEFATTQRLLIQLFVPMIVTLILGFAGMILTRA